MFSLVVIILSAVIGAGFATGAEIASFFRDMNPFFVSFFVFIFIFLFCLVFVLFGIKYKPKTVAEFFNKAFGKFSIVFECVLIVGYFIFFTAMIAGLENFGILVNIIGCSMCGIVCIFGVNWVIKVNRILIIVILLVLALVCFVGYNSGALEFPTSFSLVSVLLYVSMNIITLGAIISTFACKIKKGGAILACLLSSVILAVFVFFIMVAISDVNATFPLQVVSKDFLFIYNLAIIASIFTTQVLALNSIKEYFESRFKFKPIYIVLVVSVLGFLLSFVGFGVIIDTIYPIIGIVSLVTILFCFIRLIK